MSPGSADDQRAAQAFDATFPVSAASFSPFRIGYANGSPATVGLTPSVTANYAVVVVATDDFPGSYTLTRS